MKLDEWQKSVLKTKGDILLCTGRRVGKTYIFSRKASDRMVEKKTPIIIVSLTEDQALIIHFMALNYLNENYPGMVNERKTTLKRITLTNGSVMITRPVGDTGDATRGFEGGILIVDEASRMPKLFWLAAKPILLTTDGEIWMCSTPFGKQGYFWDRFEESHIKKKLNARFKVFYQSSEEVMSNRPISESWTLKQRKGAKRLLAEEKEEMTTLEYGQEYLGLFIDELRQLFPDDLIKERQTLDRPEIKTEGRYFLGVDIARLGDDESTFEVIDRTNRKKLKHVEHIVTKKTLTTESYTKIIELENKYRFKQIFIDAFTLGVGVFDQLLTNNRTKRKVMAIDHYSEPLDAEEKKKLKVTKAQIYNNLLGLMQRGEIDLLKGEDIFASLKSIQYEYKDNNKINVFGSYAHIADGLTRAAWCAKDKTLNIMAFC